MLTGSKWALLDYMSNVDTSKEGRGWWFQFEN